jgi:hypothetical protein
LFATDPSSQRLVEASPPVPEARGRGTPHFHTMVVSAILLFGALVLLYDPRAVASAPSGSPESVAYVLGPLGAAVYLTLVLVGVRLLWPTPFRSFFELVGIAASLALTAGLLTVCVAAVSSGATTALVRTPGFFALTFLGVSVPLLAIGYRPAPRSAFPVLAVTASILPVPFALALGLPSSSAYGTVDLAAAVLIVSAVLYQISGAMLSRPGVPVPREGRSSPLSFLRRLPSGSRRIPRGILRAAPPPAATVAASSSPPPPSPSGRSRWPDVVSTGLGWLDELLLGGLPRRGEVALWAYDGVGPDAVVATTLNEGLRRGECVVVVTAGASVTEVAELMERLGPGFCDHDREGRVLWVDASGRRRSMVPSPISGPGDHVEILQQLRTVAQTAVQRSTRGFCVGFFGLSTVLCAGDGTGGPTFVRNATAILRQFPSLTLFALDRLRPADPAARTLLQSTDGILAFRTEEDRTFVRALGLAPVETRDWVEGRFYARAVRSSEVVEEATRSLLPAPAPAASPLPPRPRSAVPDRAVGLAASFELPIAGAPAPAPLEELPPRPEPRPPELVP